MYPLIRPLLFQLPPETSHYLTLNTLNFVQQLKLSALLFGKSIQLPTTVMGLTFPNPLGLAAGLDKNAACIQGLSALGFGFIEVGTVTPRPQLGNPKPRLFRLPHAQALINRMGFNNQGVEQLLNNIKKSNFQGILGINIGKNADTPLEKAVNDYFIGLTQVYPYASYIVVNISSPNTSGLRKLQYDDEFELLLSTLKKRHVDLANRYDKYVPLVIKIAPDLTASQLESIAQKLLAYQIDGVIATNTTLSRKNVEHLPHANETGGLSGEPLFKSSTEVVKQLYHYLGGDIPIIASGGIMSVEDAIEKIQAGASLLQIYTGLIYHGPSLIKEILTDANFCHFFR